MHIKRKIDSNVKFEYNVDLYRLYPWSNVASPNWGAAIASIRPGDSTSPHSHNEFETFIIIRGSGRMTIESETETVNLGDAIFIPKNTHHFLENTSDSESLDFVTIFWDSPEARLHLQNVLSQNLDDV